MHLNTYVCIYTRTAEQESYLKPRLGGGPTSSPAFRKRLRAEDTHPPQRLCCRVTGWQKSGRKQGLEEVQPNTGGDTCPTGGSSSAPRHPRSAAPRDSRRVRGAGADGAAGAALAAQHLLCPRTWAQRQPLCREPDTGQLSPAAGDLRNRNPRPLPKPTEAAAGRGRRGAEFRAVAPAQRQTTSCQLGCSGFGGFLLPPHDRLRQPFLQHGGNKNLCKRLSAAASPWPSAATSPGHGAAPRPAAGLG